MITRRLVLPGLVAVAAGSTAAAGFRAEPATPEAADACGPRCEGEVTFTSVRVTTVDLDGPAPDLDSGGMVLRCPICGRGIGDGKPHGAMFGDPVQRL
jgi:hypothetical protein